MCLAPHRLWHPPNLKTLTASPYFPNKPPPAFLLLPLPGRDDYREEIDGDKGCSSPDEGDHSDASSEASAGFCSSPKRQRNTKPKPKAKRTPRKQQRKKSPGVTPNIDPFTGEKRKRGRPRKYPPVSPAEAAAQKRQKKRDSPTPSSTHISATTSPASAPINGTPTPTSPLPKVIPAPTSNPTPTATSHVSPTKALSPSLVAIGVDVEPTVSHKSGATLGWMSASRTAATDRDSASTPAFTPITAATNAHVHPRNDPADAGNDISAVAAAGDTASKKLTTGVQQTSPSPIPVSFPCQRVMKKMPPSLRCAPSSVAVATPAASAALMGESWCASAAAAATTASNGSASTESIPLVPLSSTRPQRDLSSPLLVQHSERRLSSTNGASSTASITAVANTDPAAGAGGGVASPDDE